MPHRCLAKCYMHKNYNMKTNKLFLFLLIFGACNPTSNHDYEFDYDIIITNQATNLNELNTKYDDFNSDLPYSYNRTYIYFSSNRTSLGENFDIIAKGLDFTSFCAPTKPRGQGKSRRSRASCPSARRVSRQYSPALAR